MYLPSSFSSAIALSIASTVLWGSWANSYKLTKNYAFSLFYWDYIAGVLLCTLFFAFTWGSFGTEGEAFLANIQNADSSNIWRAIAAGVIFNVANLLLVAAIDVAGLTIAFPIAIGIAVVEGVVLSYALQPKGNAGLLALGVGLAVAAVLFNARAYRKLSDGKANSTQFGIGLSVASGLLMGAFAPFVASAMTTGHALTPYSIAVLFAIGALLCSLVANTYLMKNPLKGEAVRFSGYWRTQPRNHVFGLLGGIAWGIGGCFNFIGAGFLGVPISYAIGQSAPVIAALWGVLVWREFAGASKASWTALALMFAFYIAAITSVSLAYRA